MSCGVLRRGVLVLSLLTGMAGVPVFASAAAAAGAPHGRISSANQNTFTHRLVIRGWAYDSRRPSASVVVRFYSHGHYLGRAVANLSSPVLDARYAIKGRHRYRASLGVHRTVGTVTARSTGVHRGTGMGLDTHAVARARATSGQRIISVAKRYVGRARYAEGGASPRHGFDCSGYTKYVYARAHVRTLPHNAEAQRHVRGMRVVSARKARPGDLVFYISSGSAYHVAIYAGHHKQYAAATPHDGIRYQSVWSSAVQYRTLRG